MNWLANSVPTQYLRCTVVRRHNIYLYMYLCTQKPELEICKRHIRKYTQPSWTLTYKIYHVSHYKSTITTSSPICSILHAINTYEVCTDQNDLHSSLIKLNLLRDSHIIYSGFNYGQLRKDIWNRISMNLRFKIHYRNKYVSMWGSNVDVNFS